MSKEMVLPGTREFGNNIANGVLKSFLDGKKNTNWLVGQLRTAIRAHHMPSQDLEDIFNRYKEYGDQNRWQEAYERCQTKEWI